MLISQSELFMAWIPLSTHSPSHLRLVFCSPNGRLCKAYRIKGNHKNVLNTSKSLQSVSYLCLLPSPPCTSSTQLESRQRKALWWNTRFGSSGRLMSCWRPPLLSTNGLPVTSLFYCSSGKEKKKKKKSYNLRGLDWFVNLKCIFFFFLSELSTHNFLQTSPHAVHSEEESGKGRLVVFSNFPSKYTNL